MKPREALVLRGDDLVGRITRTREGAVFSYDPGFLATRPSGERGVAYRLPYDVPTIETRGVNVHPFFAGLLPEGIRLRALVRREKTSEDDLLSLLVAAGPDAIGDVSVATSRELSKASHEASLDVGALGAVRFADVLGESLAGKRGTEPVIPGVQEKISAAMISLPIRARRRGSGSGAFILKLNPESAPMLVENEHFFLRMAEASGLEVASSQLVHDRDGASGLLVERFDRARAATLDVDDTAGALRKLHQEDACQFLERYPADKYVLSYAEIAAGVRELASAPIVELAKYLRAVAFSYLIANGDLHAKNVSLRTVAERAGARIELTPFYDLLSTLPYGDRSMALAFDGRDDNITRAQVLAFGERFGVRAPAVSAMLDELCDVAPAWAARLDEIGLSARKTKDLASVIDKRRSDLGTRQRVPSRAKRPSRSAR